MSKVKNNRSAEYWRRRYKAIEEKMYGISEKTSSEIKALCDSTLANIEKDIAIWYQRFANNNGITYNEALKLMKSKELKELDWDVSEYINKGRENAVTHLWEQELENASAQFHISRLEALKIQLMSHCDKVLGKADKKTESALKEVYSEGYLRTAYEMQKGLDTGFDVAKIDDELLNTIIHKPWADDGSNFSERIWGKYRPTLVNRLHRTLTDCIIRGENPNNVTEAIAKEFKAGSSAASNLVMTEYAYFTSLSRQDCLKELDVEEFEVVETLDMHTCNMCQDMDGKHYTMDKYEIGVTAPPFHPRCRGTTCPYFNDEFTVDETRAARDPITGKTVSVKDMSYSEWKDEFVKEYGQAEWDYYEKSTKNKKQDREQFERYKAILGENIPETLAEFQRIKYNDSEKWEYTKGFYRYVSANNGATKNDYDCVRELCTLFPNGSFYIPPKKTDTDILAFDDEHINKERKHNVSEDEAKSYIKEAKVSRTVWGGKFERYYSENGVAYVNQVENIIRTAFKSSEYDDEVRKILEVIKKYGI